MTQLLDISIYHFSQPSNATLQSPAFITPLHLPRSPLQEVRKLVQAGGVNEEVIAEVALLMHQNIPRPAVEVMSVIAPSTKPSIPPPHPTPTSCHVHKPSAGGSQASSGWWCQ